MASAPATASSPQDSTAAESTAPPPTTLPPLTPADAATVGAVETQLGSSPPGCDPLDVRQCVLPFPSNATTVADDTSPTGRRVSFPAQGLPANSSGVAIDPTAWNRNDGFSANTPILTHVAGLDAAASKLPSWTDLAASLDEDAPVVIVDLATGDRVPLWAEIDPESTAPDGELLVVRPAISLAPETTYAVGLRNLVSVDGEPIEPSPLFRVYRDRLETDIALVEQRRDDMDATLAALDAAGATRNELQLAWSFTTASTANTTDTILHLRDETLAGLEDAPPEFEINEVTENPDEGIARLVEGVFFVPSYLQGDGAPGSALNLGADGLPEINDVVETPYACVISDAVLAGAGAVPMVQYGHGLLGSHLEILAGNISAMTNEHPSIYCAAKWAGFSEDDVPTAISALQDLSNFPAFIDGMEQGLLNQLVLSRLMLADNGLAREPAFQRDDGSAMLDTSRLVFDGNSQGGIMGTVLAAISPDIERAVLGVTGINYSTLLPRSVDFEAFRLIFDPAYPDALDRAVGLAVIQMLWDRTDGAGYVRHLVSDPLPDTPAKDVLMHVAFGDWQVSELTAMVAARTMGIGIHRPVAADGRSREDEPGWGIDSIDYGSDTSGLVVWDSGSDPIPVEAIPPSAGRDPHEDPRADRSVRRQKAAFLFDGELIDVCGSAACTADPT